jgi:hypothetical protein
MNQFRPFFEIGSQFGKFSAAKIQAFQSEVVPHLAINAVKGAGLPGD